MYNIRQEQRGPQAGQGDTARRVASLAVCGGTGRLNGLVTPLCFPCAACSVLLLSYHFLRRPV